MNLKQTCETLGGFIEEGNCILRKPWLDSVNLKCETLNGKLERRIMTEAESMEKLGLPGRESTKEPSWRLCLFPLNNIPLIPSENMSKLIDNAQERIKSRTEWQNMTEKEREFRKQQVREYRKAEHVKKREREKEKSETYREIRLSYKKRSSFRAKRRPWERAHYEKLKKRDK